ncbi:unnamed protein product [Adineta ricciae]|uniref:Deleted in lung and esophageal cancer protein 1 Ig-like domain-containing protein n=1 Tax=Adineta ricciae TaxID=249248 RepID=A0A814CMR3_ADIRI|nr:unnamed protein product [Adineta ricciae]
MEGETAIVSSTNLDRKSNSSSPHSANRSQPSSRITSANARSNMNVSAAIRGPNTEERHTLPEIPRNPLTASVAHVVSRELGENFLKAPIRPETVKKLVVSGNVDDASHRLYVQHLREIQAKREYQLQKIGHDEQALLLADIQAHENQDNDDKTHLASLYIDEDELTRDQVILPRDFLSYNLQKQVKSDTKAEESEQVLHDVEKKLPKLAGQLQKRTLNTLWKDQISVAERAYTRGHLQLIDNLTNYHVNPRFDEVRSKQLINKSSLIRPPSLLPVFEAIPSEIVFTRYRVGDVHETTLSLRNLSSVAHSCRVIPPKTRNFCVSLSQYPSDHSLVATGLSVVYHVKFAPDTLGVFEDEIIVQCSNGTEFAVKLLAKRPPPVLTLPSLVDCGYWLAGGRKLCEFKVRNDGGEGRFAIIPAKSWPAVNFKTVVRSDTVHLSPFELAPPTFELRPDDAFPLQISFTPQTPGEFTEEFMMICDNGEVSRHKLTGMAQTIQVRLEDVEGGVVDMNELEARDISAQYSVNFISITPYSYCQRKMIIKNLTNVELPYVWTSLEPVLYTRDDFAKQSQPIEIERIVSEASPFHVEPSRGAFPPASCVEFHLIFAPAQIGNFHTVFHLIIPSAPVYPIPTPSIDHTSASKVQANERISSSESILRHSAKGPTIQPVALQLADFTVLRFETRGICENFKYIFDPFTVIFMDKLYKNIAHRKDFQLTNSSISPLVINWANVVGDEIINVEPVAAEIPPNATCLFTLILTGTKVGQVKAEIPYEIEGIEECEYFHVEAEIIGPDIDIDPTPLDFGLIEYGETVEQIIKIKNSSPILAKCRVQEVNPDESKPVLSLPENTEFTLKPVEIYDLPIRILANQEGALLHHLEVIVEDGKTIPIEITALIQRPSAYLSPVELDFSESFLNVPIVRYIELYAVNALPTHFRWGEVSCADKSQCLVEMNPPMGTIYNSRSAMIEVVFIPKQLGILNNDWHIPCYIQNASQPIFLKLNAVMKSMNVEFRRDENVFQFDEQFTLDFNNVPLGEKSRLELSVTNLTDIQSSVKANIAKFKTKIVPTMNEQKMQNFEPLNPEIGVGFHLDKADSDSYLLPPRGTAVIPVSVTSSMWGTYTDLLQLQIDGVDGIREIPLQVHITGHPIKTYLCSNQNDSNISSLPAVQFGLMLHNSLPIKKKVHMQNISHIPICIDWVVYDIPEEIPEKPKLIELISVIDNNPFNHFASETTIMENNDEIMSQTTISTKTHSRSASRISTHSAISSIDTRPTPLIKLYVEPYRGKRASDISPIFTTSPITQVIKPREHFYLEVTMLPRNCPVKDRPIKCNARVVGVLSVSEDRQGSPSQGFQRKIFYEHEEQIEFKINGSLDVPSLRVELDDDDCIIEKPDALSFVVPVGDILSCQPNLYNCTVPSTGRASSKTSAKSSTFSEQKREGKIYTHTFNLLNTRQYTIPFDLSVSDPTFLSIQPTTVTTLAPQSKVGVQCQFHLTQDFIDRFYTSNLNNNQTLSKAQQTITAEHGRRFQWREQIKVNFNQNEMEQTIPIDIRLYFPILTVNCDRIDFGKCLIEQTRQKEFIIKNLTCSSAAWSIRKVYANNPDAYEAFRIEPKSGILKTQLNKKERAAQQVISVYFTARHNQVYECQLLVEGLFDEPPIPIYLSGEGTYDGKYEAILDI